MAYVKEVIKTDSKLFKSSLLVSYSSGLYSFFTHVISTIHKTSTMDIFGVFLVNVALGEIFLSSSSFGCDSLKVNFSESFLLGSNWFLGC